MSSNQSNRQNQCISGIIEEVEIAISEIYQIQPKFSAKNFLINRQQLEDVFGDSIKNNAHWNARGSVWLSETDESFIGVFIDKQTIELLSASDPRIELSNRNLDAFCILVEELSHFHLIIHRGSRNRSINHAELEWQGEVDKLLVSGIFLQDQSGDPHIRHLSKIVYSDSEITTNANPHIYEYATKMADKLWSHALMSQPEISRNIRLISKSFKEFYRSSHSEKHSIFKKAG